MTISNTQQLHDLAGTSLASYAYLEGQGKLEDKLQAPKFGADFTPLQAAAFVEKYSLIHTQSNVDLNGFSASPIWH